MKSKKIVDSNEKRGAPSFLFCVQRRDAMVGRWHCFSQTVIPPQSCALCASRPASPFWEVGNTELSLGSVRTSLGRAKSGA